MTEIDEQRVRTSFVREPSTCAAPSSSVAGVKLTPGTTLDEVLDRFPHQDTFPNNALETFEARWGNGVFKDYDLEAVFSRELSESPRCHLLVARPSTGFVEDLFGDILHHEKNTAIYAVITEDETNRRFYIRFDGDRMQANEIRIEEPA